MQHLARNIEQLLSGQHVLSISAVSHHRMANSCEMLSDLVCASSFKAYLQMAGGLGCRQRAQVGDRTVPFKR